MQHFGPIYNGKGDVQDCGNCRGIKLTSHTLKIWEGAMEKRPRKKVNIGKGQYRFISGISVTNAVFTLRQIMEKVFRRTSVPSDPGYDLKLHLSLENRI